MKNENLCQLQKLRNIYSGPAVPLSATFAALSFFLVYLTTVCRSLVFVARAAGEDGMERRRKKQRMEVTLKRRHQSDLGKEENNKKQEKKDKNFFFFLLPKEKSIVNRDMEDVWEDKNTKERGHHKKCEPENFNSETNPCFSSIGKRISNDQNRQNRQKGN